MKRHLTPPILAAALLLATAPLLQAQTTQIWGVGTGTWDTSSLNWDLATTPAAWTNGNNATLSTTGTRTGTITVAAGGVTVNNVTLNASGSGSPYVYSIGGADIGLAGATSTWSIGGATGSQLTVGSVISGSGSLEKIGTRALILTADNTYAGTTTISAGSLQLGNGGTSGSVSGNIVANNQLIFNRSDSYTYGGVISGTSSLTQAGSGTLVLSGANTYAGNTNINAGTLRIDGSLASASINANTGGTLGGVGTIANNVNINTGGTFSPGASPGLLTIGGNLTLFTGSTTLMEIDGATRGVGYDGFDVGGVFTAAGALNLELGADPGTASFLLGSYSSLLLASNFESVAVSGSLSGSLDNLGDGLWGGTIGSHTFALTLGATQLTLDVTAAPIPEPSTYALIAGLLGLAGVMIRRRRALASA